jgi:hypothetical protein
MNNIRHIKARLPNGTLRDFDIKVSDDAPWTLEFQNLDGTLRRLQARDLFEALREMREELEIVGCQLLCAGARPDVTPSGMSRSMSGGRKAYIAHLGRPADRRTEMVDIFDPAEASEVGTTHQQRAYFQTWTASLRQSQ